MTFSFHFQRLKNVCSIIHQYTVDHQGIIAVNNVLCAAHAACDVIIWILGIESVAERLDAVLDEFLFGYSRGDGIGSIIDGGCRAGDV
jgi:hypothetical protein